MKRASLIIVVVALGAWLGASTKSEDPDDPNTPTNGVKRVLMVDAAKAKVYPRTLGLKLMGAQILRALKEIETQADQLNAMDETLSDSENRLNVVEGVIE